RDICKCILNGYTDGLRMGGEPYILAGQHNKLRRFVEINQSQFEHFWDKLLVLPAVREPVPTRALAVLERLLPEPDLTYRIVHRVTWISSLGRQRWTAIARWDNEWIAREVIALAPSACQWATEAAATELLVAKLLGCAVRSPDPYVRVEEGWITHRLAPD